MSEGADYEEVHWDSGHDFSAARATYERSSGRAYDKAQSEGMTINDLLPEFLEMSGLMSLVLAVDGTGSMGKEPGVVFSKAPYLEHEMQTEYFGEESQISVCVFGDARNSENYPLQARPFASGQAFKDYLKELVIEGKGGTGICETSECAALYYARNVRMKKNARPMFVLVTDEMPYDHVTRETAALIRVKLQQRISTKEIFDELREKYGVYIILKPYGAGGDAAITDDVRREWLRYVDEDHIVAMTDPDRVVDIIFGLMAAETKRVEYFREEIENRQKPNQVKTVYKSLETVHARFLADEDSSPDDGKSKMFRTAKRGKTKKVDDLI